MSRLALATKIAEPTLFEQIGDMMAEGGLDPNPANYDICYRHLTGTDPDLSGHVDHAIARYGALTPTALGDMPTVASKRTPRQLLKLAEDANRQIARIVELAGTSGKDASEYSEALQAADFQRDPVGAVQNLAAVTRAMIVKTAEMQTEMRKAADEATALRTDLAEARERAASDPLTGLANRRAFDTALAQAVETSKKKKTPMAVAIIDIDHFKSVNDTYGHVVGDSVIKNVANLLLETKGSPFVGRYGGEEFVLIFEGIDPSEAWMLIDAARKRMQDMALKMVSDGKPIGRITFSAGIAGPPVRTTASAMLKSADTALYRAKHQGRNQVEIAGAAE